MKIIHFCEIFLYVLIFVFQSFARQENGLNTGPDQKQFELQWKENGLPYIQNFSPTDYNAEIQNFSIVQDKRGLMYFGNNKGVLIYDGVTWRLIPTANKTLARSLCLINDTVYVGAEGDFGYLLPDKKGELRFVSLLNILPEKYRDFHDVYEITSNKDTIYLRTRNYLFRLHNGKVKVWSSENQFDAHFIFNYVLFIEQHNIGLSEMNNDSLQLLPGGNLFENKRISRMFPFDKSRFIICTYTYGLFIYDGKRVRKFKTEADNLLIKNKIYFGRKLESGHLVFGTGHGVVILDKKGRLCQVINKNTGLRNELVLNIFSDQQKGLWLALNNGIARVEAPSPYSRFKDISGMDSFVESITRYKGILYSTTERGIYYLDKNEFPFPKFKPVSGINTLSFSLATAANKLLAGTQSAVYEINGTRGVKISNFPSKRLFHSGIDTNRVYVPLIEGFAGLEHIDNKWIEIPPVPGINLRIVAVTENSDGSLLLGTEFEGLYKADIKMEFQNRYKPMMKVRLTHYGEKNGLPSGQVIPVSAGGKTVIATLKGLKYFDAAKKHFLPDTTFGKIFADSSCEIDFMHEDNNGNIWIITKMDGKTIPGLIVHGPKGKYFWNNTLFSRINDLGNSYFIYPEENGNVWIGGSEGIARYFPGISKNDFDFSAMIRKVNEISADAIFYSGNIYSNIYKPEIEYKNNSLRFEFAASSYDDPSDNLYQVKLEGYDVEWSNWFSKTDKDYTGLPSGKYIFHVRAKNIYGHLSTEDKFAFEILPPWFQTWWAYFLYILFLGALFFSIVKIRVRQLEKRTHQLENIISERTATIREQTEKLKELDRMKSRFFANISHEFRTPLTLIMGILERYLKEPGKEFSDFNIMKKNARRLLHLINQILELSKLETGSVKTRVQKTDLLKFIKRITSSFILLAEQRKIDFRFNNHSLSISSDMREILAYIDREKMETVIYNLLSNAFKFTPEGENICIDLSSNSNYAEVEIKNSGVGIPEGHLSHVFDRFYQVDTSSTRIYEGTGIGLALVKEFMELHHGEVNAESHGSETAFKIKIPLGSDHFTQDQIIEFPGTSFDETDENKKFIGADYPEMKEDTTRKISSAESSIILVVEDNFDLRNFICEQLEDDYSVIEAVDGEKGLKLAEDIIPDLVISDIMMPNKDGYQLCKELKSNIKTNHIPVVLLTAKASVENKIEGLDMGADDYLIKPFNTDELRTRVRNLIRIRKQMREKFQSEMILKPMEIIIPSTQKVFIEKLTEIIESNIEEEDFSVENLCREIGMSRTQVHRKIKAITNKSTSEFIRTYRLQRATDLIKQDAGNIAEIAYKVGFNSQSYFTKSFIEFYGCTPLDYKKQQNSKK